MKHCTALSHQAKEYARLKHLQRWALGVLATRLPCVQRQTDVLLSTVRHGGWRND